MSEEKMIKITIDGREVEMADGATILSVCKDINIDIPTLCHLDHIDPYAACRVCSVKILDGKGWEKFVTACNYPAWDGMIVDTKGEDVTDTRKINIELLMSRVGEGVKVIEDLAKEYGIEEPRFGIGEGQCILCGLCTRVCQTRVKANAIGSAGRGVDKYITPPFERQSDACIACGACYSVCPTESIKAYDRLNRKFIHPELTLRANKAIYTPIAQAVPNVPAVDRDRCIHFYQQDEKGIDACRICEDVCPTKAINLDTEDEEIQIDVGAIIVATGFQTFDPSVIPELGYKRLQNVLTSFEFELMTRADGMTEGEILMQDGSHPKSIAILHCIGSRDKNHHKYCSRVCCMYSLKMAHLIKEHSDAVIYQFYIDMRTPGKDYEEFYDRLLEEGVYFIRGKGAEVTDYATCKDEEGKLVVCAEDSLVGDSRRVPVDMVVLSTALEPRSDAGEVRRTVGIGCGGEGFFKEKHPKLAPVATTTDGVFIAGACQGPKDIPDSVAQGAAAAAEALLLIDKGKVEIEPITSTIDADVCSGCKICISLCPYTAITFDEEEGISVVNSALCKGCGTCVVACPTGAANQQHFKDNQILSQIEGVLA